MLAEHAEQLTKAKMEADAAAKALDEAKVKLGQREKVLKQS